MCRVWVFLLLSCRGTQVDDVISSPADCWDVMSEDDSSCHGCQTAQPAAYQTAGYSVTVDMLNRPLKRNGLSHIGAWQSLIKEPQTPANCYSRWQQWKFCSLLWHHCVSPKHNENLSFKENLGSHVMLWRWQRLLCHVWIPWLLGGQHYGEGLRLASSVSVPLIPEGKLISNDNTV